MRHSKFIISLLAVLIGFIIGSFLIGIIGLGTTSFGFATLFQKFFEATLGGLFNGNLSNTGEWLMITSILILTGLSVAFSYKVKIFNIGAEGQFIVGSFVSAVVGAYVTLPPFLHLVVALLSGIVAGALYGLIPGILKAYYNVSEVVVTIMLNWIAIYYTQYLVSDIYIGNASLQTKPIQDTASLGAPFLVNLFDGAKMHYGFLVAIIGMIIYYVIINKTTYGYELKAVGYNQDAANRAGMKPKSKIMSTLLISGAFAGAAGSVYSLGSVGHFTATSTFVNYGFDGITVAFLGQMSGVGMIFSALLLAGFRTTGRIFIEIPKETIDVIIGIILIFSVLGPNLIQKITKKKEDK